MVFCFITLFVSEKYAASNRKQTDSSQQRENDYHAIDYEVQKPNISRQLYRSALPTSYDDRKQHEVTSIKNQNPYGDCWAFSAMAAAETNL